MHVGMSMKESGLMIRLRDMAVLFIWMAQSIKDIGRKIDNMDMELKLGLMEQNLKVNMWRDRSMVKEHSLGKMEQSILEASLTITSKARAFISGVMAGSMKESG